MNVRVHIERLVLDGFSLNAADTRQVKAAVQGELTRLLTANGLSDELRTGDAIFSVRSGAFNPPRASSVMQLGAQIARSVHGGISRPK